MLCLDRAADYRPDGVLMKVRRIIAKCQGLRALQIDAPGDLDRVARNRHFATREIHESEADAQARREREAALAERERRKVGWTFVFARSWVATTFAGCLYRFATGSPAAKSGQRVS